MSAPLPDGLLLTYYGDDFSGSTDVMEALSVRGMNAVLFLDPPSPAELARFAGYRAVGVAGTSRSQPPEWMNTNLRPVFDALRKLGAPLCHYKVCSTFDSSPRVGSIGKAIEIGREVFGAHRTPLVVGAPILRRYVVFGNLFASVAGVHYRLDRDPTMSRHPITPMEESDIRLHLGKQTSLSVGLVDILALQAGRGLDQLEELRRESVHIALFDTLDAATLREAGRAIWETRPEEPLFVAGSSGVEYALLAWWESQGLLPPQPPVVDPGPADRLLVISGSCSPGTAAQIRWASRNGFAMVPLDATRFATEEVEFVNAFDAASRALSEGKSPVVYSAEGPAAIAGGPEFGQELGRRVGDLAAKLVGASKVRRIVVAGGDTSGHVGKALGIQALTMIRPFAPGSPLCRIWTNEPNLDGSAILFKGGQVGGEGLFGEVQKGRPF